jgi:hypothetical protein
MWLGEETWLETQGNLKFLYWRDLVESSGWRQCTRRRAYWVDSTQHIPPDDNVYRVHVASDTGYVTVACIGLESVDAIVDGNYASTNKLPKWMQEKLAVLTMMSSTPPTELVNCVGKRINADTYWVFC